jgi:hypothetical protein
MDAVIGMFRELAQMSEVGLRFRMSRSILCLAWIIGVEHHHPNILRLFSWLLKDGRASH